MRFVDLERGLIADVRKAADDGDFTVLEAVALYAHDFGHYRIVTELDAVGFKPAASMSYERWAADPDRADVVRLYRRIARLARSIENRAGGRTPNPAARGARVHVPHAARAARTFRKWHGFDPERIEVVAGPPRQIPRTLVRLGDAVEIVYRSDKWTGKPTTYTHRTGKPHPVLCTSPEGRGLFLVGGKVKVTARGLVG